MSVAVLTLGIGVGAAIAGLFLLARLRATAAENRAMRREIADLRALEVSLTGGAALRQAILDSANCSIISTDVNGTIRTFNRGAERMFGYRAEELVGVKTPAIFHVPDEVVAHARALSEEVGETVEPGFESFVYKVRRGMSDEREWTLVRADGTHFPVSLSITPLLDASGEFTGFLGIVQDFTQKKRAEADLAAARDAAEAAGNAKADFLANMSHEIRTPMNAVIGMTSVLLDSGLTAEQRDFTETIRASGETLLAIINDVLDFSKIESGKLGLELRPFDVRECAERALDLVAIAAGEKNIDLLLQIDASAPAALVGDVTRLKQVLTNLLANAVKFTHQGQILLSVASSDDGTRFSVADTGIGIPPDRISSLFDSFTQADASTTRVYGGTGLGLAISKQLVTMMGGEIHVESEPGRGTTFSFTIAAERAPALVSGLTPAPSLAGKRVLVVDDNESGCRLLCEKLNALGMAAVGAHTGRAAIELATTTAFDAAILEYRMPEMNGAELAAALSALPGEPMPIVMTSAVTDRARYAAAAARLGLAAVLNRPIKRSHLLRALHSIFGDAPVPAERPAETAPAEADLPSLRILVAEDNVVNQTVAVYLFEKLGYRIDVAKNGAEAVEAVRRQDYNVVFTDVQMPEMDGYEVTRWIRKSIPSERQPYIIAMTASAMDGDRERCLDAGMDDYVQKPIRPDALRAAIERMAR